MSTENVKRTKYAIGHFLTADEASPKSFSELVRRFGGRLREVYFPWPGLANGRPRTDKKPGQEERIISDLKSCREHGMKLDLLANATCYGESSCTADQRRQITGIIRRLDKSGLYPEIITTMSPYIARVFKRDFPDIEVRASVNMRLRNTLSFEYLAPLYDSYYICRDVQRDLPTFRRFADWCKDHSKKLCMLANSGCVRNCPWQVFHESLMSHRIFDSFQERVAQKMDFVCDMLFLQHRMAEFLRCTWIRPEDIHVFEPYLETIKLSTREAKFPFEITEAYINESYDGNLLRLMDPYHGVSFRPNRIDNKSFPADWVTSGIAGKCADNCVHCGKCDKILDQVLKYDVTPNTRAANYSFNNNFVFLAPKPAETVELSVSKKEK